MKCVCRFFLSYETIFGKSHKLQHKLHIGDTRLLPVVVIETSRERVYFVYIHLFRIRAYKKINARNTSTTECFVYANTKLFYLILEIIINIRRNFTICTIGSTPFTLFTISKIFIIKIKKLRLIERAFAFCYSRFIISHDRKCYLNKWLDGVLHQDLVVIVESDFNRIQKFFFILYPRHSYRRAEVHWLHEHRHRESFCFREHCFFIFLPLRAREPYIWHDRHPFRRDDLLRQDFVHRNCRSSQITSDEGCSRHAQKAHERTVLGIGAVHGGKDNVYLYLLR